MSEFIAALNSWFTAHPHLSQRSLSMESKVAGPDLSKIRLDKKEITKDALSKLLPAIERLSTRSHARALLVAYLNDETPSDYQPDVRIYAVDESTGCVDKDAITRARERWETKARSDATFAEFWLTMDGYMHEPSADVVDKEVADLTDPARLRFQQGREGLVEQHHGLNEELDAESIKATLRGQIARHTPGG